MANAIATETKDSEMSAIARVEIHASQFPENVRRDLLESLRLRRVNHKFHYDSIKQTQKWLALHGVYSPSRNDADCAAIYDRAFAAVAAQHQAAEAHVIGLGCGGGQKDARVLRQLSGRGRKVSYTPNDVSTAMVLVARQATSSMVSEEDCLPLVCDLATADDLAELLRKRHPDVPRVITFFGMLPNFEPENILPKLAKLVRPEDVLLVSANLAPGPDYDAGVRRILPQYDNKLTREWLLTFLLDVGVERQDGELKFGIENVVNDLKRVVADFEFTKGRRIQVENETFEFPAGEKVRLFFSYRYTPERVRKILAKYGIEMKEQWITRSAEEAVFLCGSKDCH